MGVHGSLVAEDACGRVVSCPRRMPDIPQLVAAIDNRLADIAAEIGALDAAKAELVARRVGGPAPAVAERVAPPSRRRTARRRLAPPSASRPGHRWHGGSKGSRLNY